MQTTHPRYGALELLIALLALVTIAIHLFLALSPPLETGMQVAFLFNALGYAALLAAFLLPLPFLETQRSGVRGIFVVFTLLTIVAWAIVDIPQGQITPLSVIDKLAEVALVVVLLVEGRGTAATDDPIVVSNPGDDRVIHSSEPLQS